MAKQKVNFRLPELVASFWYPKGTHAVGYGRAIDVSKNVTLRDGVFYSYTQPIAVLHHDEEAGKVLVLIERFGQSKTSTAHINAVKKEIEATGYGVPILDWEFDRRYSDRRAADNFTVDRYVEKRIAELNEAGEKAFKALKYTTFAEYADFVSKGKRFLKYLTEYARREDLDPEIDAISEISVPEIFDSEEDHVNFLTLLKSPDPANVELAHQIFKGAKKRWLKVSDSKSAKK